MTTTCTDRRHRPVCLPAWYHAGVDGCESVHVLQNTYITQPEGYGRNARFQRHKVQDILKGVVSEHMANQQYDPRQAAQTAKQIAESLREKVKALGYDRYKLVIQVTLGQKKGQAMRIVSRCLWDTETDSYASEYFENDSLYCVCQVSPKGLLGHGGLLHWGDSTPAFRLLVGSCTTEGMHTTCTRTLLCMQVYGLYYE
jgi:hypothetical protein